MKKLITSLFTAAILAATGSSLIGMGNVPTVFADDPAQTQTPIKSITMQVGNPMMTVNGEETPIRISNEYRTRQLIKKFVTEIGGKVTEDNKNIKLTYNDGQTTEDDKTIELTIDKTSAKVGDEDKTLPVAPINDNNLSTITFIAENFGLKDVTTKTVTIDTVIDKESNQEKKINITKAADGLKMNENGTISDIESGEPLALISEFVKAIGGKFDKNGEKTVTLEHNNKTIELKTDSTIAKVDKDEKTLKVEPKNDNNLSTIEFIAENFGLKEVTTKTVTIDTVINNESNQTEKKINITKTADDLKMNVGEKLINIINESDENAADKNAAPIVKDNRTLVPIRAFVEAIHGTVDWNGNTQTVTLTHKDRTIKLKINNKSAAVNGKSITLDVAPQVINDLTKMPIRFVAETFGFDVAWDGKSQTITITPEYDTFDNTTNYSAYLPSVDSEEKMTDKLSLSCDGINYYYVDAEGNAYSEPITSDDSNPQTKPIQFKEGKIDNMRVFKGHLVGIIKKDDNDEGRAFISNTDGSNFKYFAVRTGGARDYSRNIITRNEDGIDYIYLLDSSDQQSYLRKFKLNGDIVEEVEGRVFDKRLYAYSITDDYEMYIDYTDFNLHCIRRSSNATIDLGFSAYRLNNDHENFYTFKKTDDGTQYIPCRITKESLDKVFKGEKNIVDAVDKAKDKNDKNDNVEKITNSIKRLTVTKDENGTRIFYFDSDKTPQYQEIIFND